MGWIAFFSAFALTTVSNNRNIGCADLIIFFWSSCKPRSLVLVARGKSCQSSKFTLGTHKTLQFSGVLYLSCNSFNLVSKGFLEHESFMRSAIMSTTFGPKLFVSSNIEGKSVSLDSSVWELLLWAAGLPSTKIVAVGSKPESGKRPEVPDSGTDGRVSCWPETFRDNVNKDSKISRMPSWSLRLSMSNSTSSYWN